MRGLVTGVVIVAGFGPLGLVAQTPAVTPTGMPGGLEWGTTEAALTAERGTPVRREEWAMVRSMVRLTYGSPEIVPGSEVTYFIAPGHGLAKGDYTILFGSDCATAYERTRDVLGPPFSERPELDFCSLPRSMPIATWKDESGAVVGVIVDFGSGEAIVGYEAPFYEAFITGKLGGGN